MTLKPGTFLGQYEILAHIGSGGMGEVYHARDSKLHREVALKVLPEHFARDPERILRFRREAQLLAQLNHPNIAILYYFEETASARFLVMEYVPGETLRERVKRGPVPLEEALTISKQIAEALEHAHEKPIIHRDLKPANVKVTPEGQVKVLDFGLAKAFAGAAQPVDPADIPTGSQHDTLKGTILGTPAYMSPEQARGKEADKRADIWSFGCVLYELLSGKQAFQGETITDILAKVLEGEPDWTALPANTSPHLRFLLRRCLEKDAKRRFRDAADIQIQIEETRSTAKQPAVSLPAAAPPPPPRALWRRAIPSVGSALIAVLITAGIALWNRPAPAPQPVSRFEVSLPPNSLLAAPFGGLDNPAIVLSPDGSHLVYVGVTASGRSQLFLRALDSLEAKPIPGTEGATYGPFFSPDGQWLGFFGDDNTLKKVSLSGGAAVTLTRVVGFQGGASWGANDTILFQTSANGSLLQVPASGGTPQPFTTLQGELRHTWPEFLPGGKAVLFAVYPTGAGNLDEVQIAVQGFPAGDRKVLLQGGTNPHYVPTGHLVFERAGTLMAAPFNLARLEVTGPAVPILEGVMESQFSISNRGSLAYVPGSFNANQSRLVWVDRNGTVEPLPAPQRLYQPPRLSPDGRRIATVIQRNVWVYDISRDILTRLTFEPSGSSFSAWTPDGKRVTFHGNKGGPSGLFWTPADGSGPEERLATSEHFLVPGSWSPDGKLFAFTEVNPATNDDLWVLSVEGDPSTGSRQAPSTGSARPSSGQAGQGRKAQAFLQTPFREGRAKFSPDGRWLAYVSDESGRAEVYVQPYPGPGGKWQISSEGGNEIVWARNGELFYRSGDNMMAVETTTQPTFSPGRPRLLFEGQYAIGGGGGAAYDVTPDGQRFLMLKTTEQEQPATQIHVVLNWFEELKRRVPAP